MDFKTLSQDIINTILRHESLLIIIKGSPDPDAIASSYALKLISDSLNVKAKIVSLIEPSLPQNRAVIKDLDIPVFFEDPAENVTDYKAYAVLDFQSVYIKGVSEKIPCIIHIDHHKSDEEDISVECRVIIEESGSTSTIFTHLIKEMHEKLEQKALVSVSTALVYGIQTDTDGFRHASRLDYIALDFLSRYSDRNVIDHITGLPLPGRMLGMLGKAIENREAYKDWLFTGLGFIDSTERDNIALVSDFLKRREKYKTVVVFAAVENRNDGKLQLDASFRTDDEDMDLNGLIKQSVSEGGARKYKGAYQVDINYFAKCPDRDLLWNVINITTLEVLKKMRDDLRFIELKGFYIRFKKNIKRLFKA